MAPNRIKKRDMRNKKTVFSNKGPPKKIIVSRDGPAKKGNGVCSKYIKLALRCICQGHQIGKTETETDSLLKLCAIFIQSVRPCLDYTV